MNGTIIDASTKEPLAGASVQIAGVTHRTTADDKGAFRLITGQPFPYTLIVSYIGYKSDTVIVQRSPIQIALEPDATLLEDVVVTGYSTQQRKYIVGAIASVRAEALNEIPAAGINQLLQGKVSGVQVGANSGVPGGGVTFRIRGNNSINASVDPLYVVDGVFISNNDPITTGMGNQQQSNPLADLNPSDIEDVQILKDANATAIYGSLGANGVVIITTKRGKQNTKGSISFNTYQGWSEAAKRFRVTDGATTAQLFNESALNTAIDDGRDPATATLPFSDAANFATYNRIDDLFRTARTQNYELSAQGGNANSNYYISFGYLDQESIVKPSGFNRYTGRINYDNAVTSKLKVGTSINLSRTYRNVSSSDNNPRGVINSAIFPRSFLPVYNGDGTFARHGSFDNHIALIENLDNNAVGWRTIGNGYAEYTILPELRLRSSWSLDNNSVYENNYANTLIIAGLSVGGSASSVETKNLVLLNEQVLTYIKTFGNNGTHHINALVGNTLQNVLDQSTSASGQGFATNNLKDISVAATRSGSSSRAQSKLVSFFGKATYTYLGRYTVDASLRGDASSKFGANSRWGYFPSAGLTWRAGQEPFVQNLNVFSDLIFRASIGLSGNQNGIGAYAAQGLWSSGANYLEQPGTSPSQLANPNLTWETTRQINVGLDLSFFRNRLHITADYYNKYTYDLLLNVPVPYRSGFTSYLQNYGAVRNKGIELALNSVNVANRNFRWSADFNISFNRNKIEKLASDITQGASGRNTSILRAGYPVNSFYLYRQLYVDPQTGNAVYQDLNNDGIITSADRHIVGNALPNYTSGLTNNLSYKGFDFSFFFYFQQGNKILNMHDFFLVHGGTQANIGFIPRQLERWQQSGDITDIPRLTTYRGDPTENNSATNNYGGNVASLSSRYLEDGSFIRLRTVSLGYTLPPTVSNKIGLSRLRAYLQATNLLTFTNYGGLDPEVSSQSASQNTAGYDWATVPQPRTIQLGFNLTL
ncbi:TonB-dependent receptor [Parapedobacter sp. ISTM3]|uniref:SusC/RagA family TonB-linked outer membrane protein n=1 Tax=Parapedobacter sp. ISTM3 TaxID=2800130 RepID=UPI001906B3C3|nr:TonB-dependent receptor [Parapedobacter sp. ISTM3]MBK1438547.1 TonB-dependent receptor [Parapedobacter sp. ISTM3]